MAAVLLAACGKNTPKQTAPATEPEAAPAAEEEPQTEASDAEKLIGTWVYDPGNNLSISYTFNDDNTGLLVQTVPTMDMTTMEQSTKTTETEIKYSVISPGVIRIVTGDRYVDYEYKFVKKNLQLQDADHYSKNIYKKK